MLARVSFSSILFLCAVAATPKATAASADRTQTTVRVRDHVVRPHPLLDRGGHSADAAKSAGSICNLASLARHGEIAPNTGGGILSPGVAAVGDPSPIGGVFGAVGPGSLNNRRKIVFLASRPATTTSDIFMWDAGVVTKVAAVGDPAPAGGTYSFLGTESFGFVDGTNIPTGPVPDINDVDQINFRAYVSGGITPGGLIVRTAGLDQWYVKVPDPTPAGGTFFDMQAAAINNAGQIAFFADYRPTPSTFNSGWFSGAPGDWRKVIVFFDPVDGGECLGLAYSRNPMQTIDREGNVVLWTDLNSNGGEDRLVIGLTDGSLLIGARRGEPSPNGGTLGGFDAWPAVSGYRSTLNASTPGAMGGSLSAHMVIDRCNPLVAVQDLHAPRGVELLANYPNPFTGSTRIAFSLAEGKALSVTIVNVAGETVATVASGYHAAGTHGVEWDATGEASGVYFCHLRADDFVSTRKLVMTR